MSETHEILRIFVASPSGLDEERRAIWNVVEEINRRNSSHWRLQFQAVGWEDTVGGNRRAQELINRDLETCDFFFGVLSDHWGSPSQSEGDVGTPYTSGFHEEYELAQEMSVEGKMNDILLFFKDIPDDRMRDIGPSLQQVLDFRNRVREGKKLFYTEFNDLEMFRQKIGDALTKIGWDSTSHNSSTDIAVPSGRNTKEVGPVPEKSTDSNDFVFPDQTRKFLDVVRGKRGDYNAITNVDVARLRLISCRLGRVGNDEAHIGVHDANLLFRCRAEVNLSQEEKTTLLIAGLRQLEHQNAPFWHWTGGDVNVVERLIQGGMMTEEESVTSSALRIAEIFGYSAMPTHRQYCIQKWFNAQRASSVHSAAQSYLSRWAKDEDIPTLQEIRDGSGGQKANELDGIIVAIKFRSSPADGLNELKNRNPENIPPALREILQDLIRGLSSELLEELARLKAEYLRLISIKELSRRNALSRQLAEELSGDDSTEVRLEAMKALSDMSVPISESKAREALVVQSANQGLGGFLRGGGHINDTSKFEEYQRHLLKKKSHPELVAIENEDTPFKADALLTACQMFPRKTGKLLRNGLMDGFDGRFEDHLKRLSPGLVTKARDLKKFCCLRQTNSALEILARQQKREDLSLIREVLDRSEIEASSEVLAYFGRFGSWEDADRILRLKPKVSASWLNVDHAENDELIGRALFKVGSARMVDLIDKIESVTIKAAVIVACTQTVFVGLSDEKLLELINEEDDKIRRLAALKCLTSLPKSRIKKLFEMYMNRQDYRYYNAIHWLDFGVTMTRSIVRKVARREMKAA